MLRADGLFATDHDGIDEFGESCAVVDWIGICFSFMRDVFSTSLPRIC